MNMQRNIFFFAQGLKGSRIERIPQLQSDGGERKGMGRIISAMESLPPDTPTAT